MIHTNLLRNLALVLLAALPLLVACATPAPDTGGDTPGDQPVTRGLATVEDIDILILESFPVQVRVVVKGSLPDSCTQVDQVSQELDPEADIFWIEITTVRPADAICAQVIGSFEQTIALDVYGLPAGTYTVDANGVTGTFTLSVDNVLDTGLPNPASVHCEEHGYWLEVRTDEQGNQYGVCIFPDGSECDEWAFYRGECGPTSRSTDTSPTLPIPADWQAYVNARFGYQFSYPANATITEIGVQGFPSDELPEGKTADEYVTELQEVYGNTLCVSVAYELGYVNLSAPINEGFRYATCGRTGVGSGEMIDKSETIVIAGQSYTATGFEFIGEGEPCEALYCHNETFVLRLPDGTRVEYGAAPVGEATYDDYQAATRDVLLQIVSSFVPGE